MACRSGVSCHRHLHWSRLHSLHEALRDICSVGLTPCNYNLISHPGRIPDDAKRHEL